MNMPNWALALFFVIGLGFILLGPSGELVNLAIYCAAVAILAALVALAGQFLGALFGSRKASQPAGDAVRCVQIGRKVYPVVDSHVDAGQMTRHEYQDYMNNVTQAVDTVTGKVCNLPVFNTSYRMTPGDDTAGGHNDDWRD